MTRKAAIFDLDGTLLNTLDDITDSMNSTLTYYGLDTHSTDEYKLMVGTGAYDLVKKAVLTSSPEMDEEMITEILDYYTSLLSKTHAAGNTRPYPGIPEGLVKLAERGIKLAVLSNKPDEAAKAAVSHCLPDISFSHVQGQKDGVARKPDPAAVYTILNSLGLSKDEVVYFGDSGVDMQTARNSGLFAVGVLWGYRDESELLRDGADALIDNPHDITRFFE